MTAGLVIPAIVTVAALEFVSAQVPLMVIVTTWPDVEPVVVPVQVPVNPDAKVTVGDAGITKPDAKVAVTVFAAAPLNAPVALLLKPTVQIAVELADCGEPTKVTVVGVVAAAITTDDEGLAATESADVATLNEVAE